MKKLLFLFVIFLSKISWVFAATRSVWSTDIKDHIIPGSQGQDVVAWDQNSWLSLLDSVFGFAKDSIFRLMMLIWVGVFLFIGIRLVVARGNPEEFKKAMLHFIYAVIGIFVVSVSWAAVRLVSGLNF